MSAFSRRVAKQAGRSAVFVSALAVGCAEGAQDGGKLDEGTLTGAGTSGTAGGGTAGASATSGTGGGGAPGSAGTSGASSTSGAAGMAGGGAGAGGGGSGGAGGAGAGGGGAMNGGAGGASGSGGSGGQAADGFRYAKLVATSEQTGKVWSSCAELKLFTSAGAEIPQNTWTVTADSEETDDESSPASAVKDGDINTFWHTSWEPGGEGDAPLPHHLIVDTGKLQAITGFSYLPRQEGTNGRIKDYEFYLSKDGTTWGAAVKTGAFPAGLDAQKISF